jgi:5-methylcytosine-specific restriction endonuclease McrA
LKIVTRGEAYALGLTRYFTGKPCKHGHVCERSVSSRNCIECIKRAVKKYQKANREKTRVWQKTSRERDPDAVRARHKKYLISEVGRENHRKASKRHYDSNPEIYIANVRKRRARKRGAEGSHSAQDIKRIRLLQKDKCAYCKTKLKGSGQVDHIVALSRGGTDFPANLQLTCGTCNSRKHAKCPQTFARELGMLL